MKTYYAFTFLLLVCGTLAEGYKPLNVDTTSKSQNQLIQDLKQLGAQYTLEKGIFQNTPSDTGTLLKQKALKSELLMASLITSLLFRPDVKVSPISSERGMLFPLDLLMETPLFNLTATKFLTQILKVLSLLMLPILLTWDC